MNENLRTYLQSKEGQHLCINNESMLGCLKQYDNMVFYENENYIIIDDENYEDPSYIDKRKILNVYADFMSCKVIGKGVQLEIHQ